MTSRQQTIASMLTVVAEGRCALLATYQIFQFIVGYAMAQAFSTNLMYTYSLQMGNYQFLIQVWGCREVDFSIRRCHL
jgi:magnesium-transporting ATPase (P-type)